MSYTYVPAGHDDAPTPHNVERTSDPVIEDIVQTILEASVHRHYRHSLSSPSKPAGTPTDHSKLFERWRQFWNTWLFFDTRTPIERILAHRDLRIRDIDRAFQDDRVQELITNYVAYTTSNATSSSRVQKRHVADISQIYGDLRFVATDLVHTFDVGIVPNSTPFCNEYERARERVYVVNRPVDAYFGSCNYGGLFINHSTLGRSAFNSTTNGVLVNFGQVNANLLTNLATHCVIINAGMMTNISQYTLGVRSVRIIDTTGVCTVDQLTSESYLDTALHITRPQGIGRELDTYLQELLGYCRYDPHAIHGRYGSTPGETIADELFDLVDAQ